MPSSGFAGPYDGFVGYQGKWGIGSRRTIRICGKLLYSAVGKNPELKVRLLHGESDSTVPFNCSAAFEAVLLEAGYEVEVISFDDGHIIPPDLTIKAIWDVIRDAPGNEPDR